MTEFTTPVGRMVAGSMYKANDKAFDGSPLVTKTGANTGQPRVEYYFGIAIPKGAEQGWWETPWGQIIYAEAMAAFPQGQPNQQGFAWKIVDGDSQAPNKRNKIPCQQVGFPGHWVLGFSSGFPPKIYNADGTQQIMEPDAIKAGYFIQVHGNVAGNNNIANPGVYLNHNLVALAGYGEEIHTGPDAAGVGFGGALPAGASATPVGGGFNPAPQGQPQQQMPQGQPQQQMPQGQPQQGMPQGQPQQGMPQGQPQQGPGGVQPHNNFTNPQVQ